MADTKAPAWGYRKDEAQIFEDGVIPSGWVDSPAKVKGAKQTYPDISATVAVEAIEGAAE